MLKELFTISAYPSLLHAEKRPFWDKVLTVIKTYGLIFLGLIVTGWTIVLADYLVVHVLHHKSIQDQYSTTMQQMMKKIGYVKALFYICLIGPILEEVVFRLSLSFKKVHLALSIAAIVFMFGNVVPFVKNLSTNPGLGYALLMRIAFSVLVYFVCIKLLPGGRSFTPSFKKTVITISIVVFGLVHISNFIPLQWVLLWIYPFFVLPQLMMGWGITYVRFKNGFIWGIAMHCLINSMSMLVYSHPPEEMKGKQVQGVPSKKIDTSKSFKIDTFWIRPKPILDFNSVDHISKDTIDLAICAEYVYSPFGKIKNRSALKNSLLRDFSVTNRTDSAVDKNVTLQSLKHHTSKLLLFFDNDPEASRESYIIKGEIYDEDINFSNNIRIGMTYDDFCKTFFENFPPPLQKKYQVMSFESCIDGIRHIYSFKDGKLHSVKFECVKCSWSIGY